MMTPNRPDCENRALPPKPYITTGQVWFGVGSVLTGLLGIYFLSLQTDIDKKALAAARESFEFYSQKPLGQREPSMMIERLAVELKLTAGVEPPLRSWRLGNVQSHFPFGRTSISFVLTANDGRHVSGRLLYMGRYLAFISTDGAKASNTVTR